MAQKIYSRQEVEALDVDGVVQFAQEQGLDEEDVAVLRKRKIRGRVLQSMTVEEFMKAGLELGPAKELMLALDKVFGRGPGSASGDTENKGQASRVAEEKKEDQGVHVGEKRRKLLPNLEETCIHPYCDERVTIKNLATHLLEVHGQDLRVPCKLQGAVITIAEHLMKRGGVFVPSLGTHKLQGLEDDGMLSCAFGVQNTVAFVHLDCKVGRLGLVKQNRCWTAHFTEDNLIGLRDLISCMGFDVVVVTGVTNDVYHWLGWAMQHNKWVVCGDVWSFHVEDEEWEYELKLN